MTALRIALKGALESSDFGPVAISSFFMSTAGVRDRKDA